MYIKLVADRFVLYIFIYISKHKHVHTYMYITLKADRSIVGEGRTDKSLLLIFSFVLYLCTYIYTFIYISKNT